MSDGRQAKKASMPGSEDRISALPDGVLQHVLGFLAARDAVRTSVLASRWRYAWRSIRRLHVSPGDGWNSAEDLKGFLDTLLFPGDHGSILEEVKLDFDGLGMVEDDLDVKVWIQQILSGQAQVLDVSFATLETPNLVSRHMRKLELTEVELRIKHLDFASCPVLEDLTMAYSNLSIDKISSQSVKRLQINDTVFFCACPESVCRPTVSTPGLVWLQLDSCGCIPFLESMPSLQTAFVKPTPYLGSEDRCERAFLDVVECCGICAKCTGGDGHRDCRVLLGGLSSAINLELIADFGMLTFGRDMRRCPTFSNLKTLLLNEWCVAIDSRSLVCMLEHSPVLEKLTLQLPKRSEPTTVLGGSWYPLEELPAISKHLNIVEIKCGGVDERVCRILELMSRFVNVSQINIKLVTQWSTCKLTSGTDISVLLCSCDRSAKTLLSSSGENGGFSFEK